MIKLTEIIVKRPISAIVIIMGIIVFGVMSIFDMPQELIPDMDMPMLVVSTVYPGAGPDDVERLVSSVIKDSLGAERGIRNLLSNSMENVSFVMLQFAFGHDLDRAYNSVSRVLDSIANDLPDDAMTPVVFTFDINMMPTMSLSVHSETIENLLLYVQDEIVPQFSRLLSVANVDVFGGRETYIRVEVIEEALNQHFLSIHNVIAAISGVNHTAPLGTAAFGELDLAVRVQVRHESIYELGRIPLTLPMGDVIRLSDVTNIHRSIMDSANISRFNQNERIVLHLFHPHDFSANQMSADVYRVIDQILAANPNISIEVTHDDSVIIADSIFSIAQTLLLAIGLSMIILFLFLGDFRASLIVGSSMPISILVTFIFMDFMGFTLNLITMSGLIIGVAMIVDNAIVVIDSCFRANQTHKSFVEAAIEGTRFVMLSIFAITLTAVVVFVPIALIEGMAGQMFRPLGISVVFALVASLMSAVSLVPLFFVQFKPIERKNAPVHKIFNKMVEGYAKLLRLFLGRRIIVLGATITVVVISVFLVSFLNVELIPAPDEGIVSISIATRPGLNTEHVNKILMELEEMVAAHPDVSHFMLTGGTGGSSLTAHLRSDRVMHTSEVIEQWRFETASILDADIDVSASSMVGMMVMDGINVMLMGETLDGVREASIIVEEFVAAHPNIIRVNSTIERANPQAEIVVDPLMAAFHGITPPMVTGSAFIALNGSSPADITIDNQRYSIRVEFPNGRYETVSDLANMMIMSTTGSLVPLSEISDIVFTDTPQTISRQNGMYTVTVTGIATEAERFIAQADILSGVQNLALPAGVTTGLGIQDELQAEEIASLVMAVAASVILVFMVLAIQFESIRHALMVMTCVPLAFIGSLLLMFLVGTTISMVSLLGFVILIGLVVNNGILFVDATNKYRFEMPLQEALIKAGRTRLRPILMTALTSVLAMMPLALGFGDEMMQGLGVAVVGGLTASTILALLFLPTFYMIIDGNSEKREKRRKERTERREMKIASQMLE